MTRTVGESSILQSFIDIAPRDFLHSVEMKKWLLGDCVCAMPIMRRTHDQTFRQQNRG